MSGEDDRYFIVSENALENYVCSKCSNYMSVGPLVWLDGNPVCGRCNHDKLGPVIQEIPAQDKALPRKLFRCINRYDGCRELLKYETVSDHEKICQYQVRKGSEFYCCFCNYQGNMCQLYNHFKTKHSISDKYTLKLYFKQDGFLPIFKKLYRYFDFIFVVRVGVKKNEELVIDVMNFGNFNRSLGLKFKLKLSDFNTKKEYCFPEKECDVRRGLPKQFTHQGVSVLLSDLKGHLGLTKLFDIFCEITFSSSQNPPVYIRSSSLVKPHESVGTDELHTSNEDQQSIECCIIL